MTSLALVVVVSVQTVHGLVIISGTLFHDFLVVCLVEAVSLDEFADGRHVCALQHGCLALLQSGVHLELELSSLVGAVIDDLIDAHWYVARVRLPAVISRQRSLHLLRSLHLSHLVVHIQHQYQLPLRVSLLEKLILRHRRLVPEHVRQQQTHAPIELAIRQVLHLHVHTALVFQETLRELTRSLEQ